MRVLLMIKGIRKRAQRPARTPDRDGQVQHELRQAGVLLDLAGLLPSAEGRRVRFSEGNPAAIDGPFPESKELVAGYWILQVPSMDEAVEWAKRAPPDADPGQAVTSSPIPRANSHTDQPM